MPLISNAFCHLKLNPCISDRDGRIFTSSPGFCTAWSVLYDMSLEMSVFMVAMLSVSRLVLLIFPFTTLRTTLTWTIPAIYCLITLVIKVVFMLCNVNTVVFIPQLMSCVPVAFDGTFSETTGEPMVNLTNEMVLSVVTTIQIGVTVLPISLSSCLSVIYIQRSRKTKKVVTLKDKQNMASLTVVMVTAVYIICNIPLFIYHIYFWMWNLSIDRREVYMLHSEFSETYSDYFQSVFLQSYSYLLASRMFPVIDGALNPVVYAWRFGRYRTFLRRLVKSCILWDYQKVIMRRNSIISGV